MVVAAGEIVSSGSDVSGTILRVKFSCPSLKSSSKIDTLTHWIRCVLSNDSKFSFWS